MQNDRTAKIEAAKTYFGRILNFINEARELHDHSRNICLATKDLEIVAWWKTRSEFICTAGHCFNALWHGIGATPLDFDSKVTKRNLANSSAEYVAAIRERNEQILKLGMDRVTADWMEKIADPATHPLPPGLTGGVFELADHQYRHAALQIRKHITAIPIKDHRAALLDLAAKSDSHPIRDLCGTLAQGNCGNLLQVIDMYVSSISPDTVRKLYSKAEANSSHREPDQSTLNTNPPAVHTPSAQLQRSAGDPEQIARDEFRAMSSEQKSAWIDEKTFVAVRKAELNRNSFHAGDSPQTLHASADSDEEVDALIDREWSANMNNCRDGFIDKKTYAGLLSASIAITRSWPVSLSAPSTVHRIARSVVKCGLQL